MNKISREKAKEILLQICYDGEFPNDSSLAFNKAISDMDKLDKIEQIVKCNTEGTCHETEQKCFECMYDKIIEIEQIVKEV